MNKEELIKQIFTKHTFLCVGLDPDKNKMPTHLMHDEDPIFTFNKKIIDSTAPYCIAYKPNLAFYECYGVKGLISFEKTVNYIKTNYPNHFLIADAKRGDIGNTSRMYAKTFFEQYDVDALTVAPYMGEDSVTPFLEYSNKWVILLALTSNKGSNDFQFFADKDGNHLFETVIKKSQEWQCTNNLMYVVGATQGSMFTSIRKIIPKSFILVPGVGTQGGSLDEVCKYGMTDNCGLIINSSRGIIYASNSTDFAEAAAEQAKLLQQEMSNKL